MTYNVFGGTLSLNQSINQSITIYIRCSLTEQLLVIMVQRCEVVVECRLIDTYSVLYGSSQRDSRQTARTTTECRCKQEIFTQCTLGCRTESIYSKSCEKYVFNQNNTYV